MWIVNVLNTFNIYVIRIYVVLEKHLKTFSYKINLNLEIKYVNWKYNIYKEQISRI